MKMVNILIIAIVALLSVAAGLVQVLGGVLLVPKKTRLPGAILATSALVVSAVLIFVGGNLTFGLVSMLPIALAGVIIYQSARNTNSK